jgi:TP901 family phage tail tape measure protein
MADLARTVQIIFNATDNTGGVLSNIGGNIEGFASKAGNVLAPLDALADKVKLADAAIVGLGLALGGAALIKAGEFGDQINEIGTLFGGSKDQIDAFSQQVQTYAAGSTQSLGDINGAVYAAISAGVKYSDSLAFMADAEKLAIAGKAGLKETTLALVGTLNAYGASTQDAAKYSDVLFQTVKAGQITLPELATGLGQVTGIASSAGIPFADLSAAIAALTSYGIPGAQAITGLKAAIGNIINPSGDAAKAAVELGVGFDASALKSKGFAGVLADVYKATNGNTGKMTEFFGSIEGLNVALTLGGDKAGKFAGSLDGMAASTGATAAAFETMKDNFSIVVQQMKNGVDLLLVSIGGPLQDEFAGLAGAFGDVFKNLKISVDKGAFDPIFAVIGDVEDDLTAFIGKIAQNLPAALDKVDWSKFTAGIQALSDGLGGMFSGLNLDTPEGLAAAMQLAADAAGNLLAQGGGIAESWGAVITNVILPAVKAFADMSTEMSKNSSEALGWADALSMITGVVGKVGEGLKGIGDGLTLLSGAFYAAIFKSMIPAIEAFGLASLSKSGIVGVFLIIAEVLGKLVAGEGPIEMAAKALYRMATSGGEADIKLTQLKDSAKAGADEVAKLGQTADTAATGLQKATAATSSLKEVTFAMAAVAGEAATKNEFLARSAEAMAVASGKVKEETKLVSDGFDSFTQGVGKSAKAMAETAQSYLETARAAGTLEEAHKVVRAEYDKLYAATGKVVKTTGDYKGAMEDASAASKDSAKDLIALAKVAGDYETKLAQIASNEKIKVIESKFKLNIAEVEAQTKVAVALIESIGKTYEANTSLVGNLMDSVSGSNTFGDRTKLALAAEANQRANDLHKAQIDLIQKNSDYLVAKTKAANNGNPLITIQADGLKPHLEAFMWEILGAIQVKMAYDGGDMLVGGCSL